MGAGSHPSKDVSPSARASPVPRIPQHVARMTPELSIAIVLYNSAEALEDCLHSLRPLIEDGFAEVIAVDNASPDDSVEILLSELPQAKLIQLDQNRGFAAGANAG